MTEHQLAGYQSVAQLIQDRQNALGKTDHQIAVALGYTRENVIAMMKKGHMRVPVNRVVELAGALDVDAPQLLRLVLSETDPGLLQALERILGPISLSPAEEKLIQAVRKVAQGRDAVPMVLDRNALVALVVA